MALNRRKEQVLAALETTGKAQVVRCAHGDNYRFPRAAAILARNSVNQFVTTTTTYGTESPCAISTNCFPSGETSYEWCPAPLVYLSGNNTSRDVTENVGDVLMCAATNACAARYSRPYDFFTA